MEIIDFSKRKETLGIHLSKPIKTKKRKSVFLDENHYDPLTLRFRKEKELKEELEKLDLINENGELKAPYNGESNNSEDFTRGPKLVKKRKPNNKQD